MTLTFSNTGSLNEWTTPHGNIIPPIKTFTDIKKRGGALLCIPNFENLTPPFSVRHGEYRVTPCNTDLPHTKTVTSGDKGGWGSAEVFTQWTEECTDTVSVLTVTTKITATRDNTYLRPGFHPYFTTDSTYSVHISGEEVASNSTFINDTPQHLRVGLGINTSSVNLTTTKHNIEITASVLEWPKEELPDISYTVWSDDIAEYICVEPSVGSHYADNSNLPEPITLQNLDVVTVSFVIKATTRH